MRPSTSTGGPSGCGRAAPSRPSAWRTFLSGREISAAAGDELKHAVSLLPNSPRLHVNYAYCLFQTGRLNEAMAECETALRLEPDFADARKVEAQIRLAPHGGP